MSKIYQASTDGCQVHKPSEHLAKSQSSLVSFYHQQTQAKCTMAITTASCYQQNEQTA
ncbi:hypothetical protein [Moraxella cuniculi]|uniref:hypothetical protein n=1 Tax=Moraxella cuniculi TaxID=34061 RepID=UPI00130120E3|nr:hypothetical protein [Moraxella cuniculi]